MRYCLNTKKAIYSGLPDNNDRLPISYFATAHNYRYNK